MNEKFKKEYLNIRDDTIIDVLENEYNWNNFINYWSNQIEKYSVDNILNLYSYNPYGKTFLTFDEWNSDIVDRRIKPKSKGIPILKDGYKVYVFDIKQTYGKDFNLWKYNHLINDSLLAYFKNEYNINENISFYEMFKILSKDKINNNYNNIDAKGVELITSTMSLLLLSKLNFNNYNECKETFSLTSNYEKNDFLMYLQIINKEVFDVFETVKDRAIKIDKVQDKLRNIVLEEYKNNNFISNIDLQNILELTEHESGLKYEDIKNIYDGLIVKYSYINKKQISLTEKIITKKEDDIQIESHSNKKISTEKGQLSLFTPEYEELANKICNIFNSFDTKYKNSFVIDNVELEKWEHISSKKRNLTILLKSPLADDMGEDSFTYFNSNKTDEKKLYDGINNNYFLQELYKDKDFDISFTPTLIHIFWHNFDDKQFDLDIPSTKLVKEEKQEIIDDTPFYKVTSGEFVPGVSNDNITPTYYNKEGKELNVKEELTKINYHISDAKVDSSFGAKTRFKDNIDAITLLKNIESENRLATNDEQEILSKYVGWGGIADVFDENKGNYSTEREQLKNLLSEEEYKDARKSTVSSFYTPNKVIDGIYKALEKFGFEKGNILEPSCGIGNFFGRLPEKMENSKLHGIEIDGISGRIAKQLYQNAKIEIKGYEETKIQDNLFDVAIGNVPFVNSSVFDRRYKENFKIHDYFFQKTLDKVRAGGIIAFITSSGTLDKKDKSIREYIAKRAEFIGAIRLPNDTFMGNANTSVTTDIIFLKKRDELKLDVSDERWLYTGENFEGITINNYFIDNPDMALGKIELKSTQFGMKPTLKPLDIPLEQLLDYAISNLPNDIYEQAVYELNDENSKFEILEAHDNVKNNAFIIINKDNKDIIYQRKDSVLVPYTIQDGMTAKRIIGLCKVKNALRKIFEIQLNDGSDEELKQAQNNLNYEYENFVKKYSFINDNANSRAFSDDPDYYLLTSIEVKISKDEEDEKPTYIKGDVFSKRTIRKNKEITNVDSAENALRCSLNKRGIVDLEYMKTIYNKNTEEIIEELKDVIYQDPSKINDANKGWVIESEYLSGNVKEKLKIARAENVDNIYDKNVKALEAVQPIPLEFDEISFKLGSTWIPEDVYQQFCYDLLDIHPYEQTLLSIKYVPEGNTWLFQAQGLYGYGIKNTSTWGTDRMDALAIIKNTLNLQAVTIFDKLEDERRIVNTIETANAREKQELIKQEFKDWLWKDENRKERIVKIYNERFNCIREREYDGSHLTFDGMNSTINLLDHQKDAVARVIYGGNTLLAHAVGAGKTYECIASTMELKRLGLVSKPMFVVPNDLLGQWAKEVLVLYPNANVLVATQKDLEKKNRKKLIGKIATGDWDAVLIAHSSFGLIPMSREYEKRHIEKQLEEITDAIERIKIESNERISVKRLEQTRMSVEAKLKKLLDTKRDDVATFEELGVDQLIVDEAHLFKNLPMYSKMRNVAGVNNTDSKKATDLFMKISYIFETYNGKKVVFATGTPISNSMGELYIMQKYLQPYRLKEMGLDSFDEWASAFGEIVNSYEIDVNGKGFKTKARFSQFYNLPELMALFKEIADIKTSKMLNLPVPKLKDGERKTIVAPKTDELSEYIEKLAKRSEIIKQGCDPRKDNMLLVTNDGRKAALDLRLIDNSMPDLPNSKINIAVENIYKIWLETKENRLTQLVFCDLSTPHNDGRFNVYDDIKRKLILKGIPENEIEYIHNAKTNPQKIKLFEDMRSGIKRILIGSTSKMGAGMNVQDKLIALHHLDCPWRPSDIEQREGRILRQGNLNEEVEIYRYITEGSFDAYSYQLIQTKSTFINQIMSDSHSAGRSAEDLDRDTLTYAEVKALASGNQLVLDKFKVENELSQLYLSKNRYNKLHSELSVKYNVTFKEQLAALENYYSNLLVDVKNIEDLSGDSFKITLKNVKYINRKNASTIFYQLLSTLKVEEETKIGEISGFDIIGLKDELRYSPVIYIKGATKHKVEINNMDEIGNIYKLENMLKSFQNKIDDTEKRIEYTKKQMEDARIELEKPFAMEEKIKELQKEKIRIDNELDLDKPEINQEIEDNKEEEINER